MGNAMLTRKRILPSNNYLFGLSWEESNLTGGRFIDIKYNDGIWVISCNGDFSETPISGLLYSIDGESWSQSNVEAGYFSSLDYGNGVWVAGAYYGYESNIVGLWYSLDGKAWIDWRKTKESGIEFAMIREGYGKNNPSQIDDCSHRNADEATKSGIPFGVYHLSLTHKYHTLDIY